MRRTLAAPLLALFVVSCTVTPGPSASGGPAGLGAKPTINEQTRGELQALLQKQHDTLASRDQNGYVATVDQERLALRRCANETFDIAGRQGVTGVAQVGKIEPYLDTYVRGYVQEGSNGLRRMYFRKTPRTVLPVRLVDFERSPSGSPAALSTDSDGTPSGILDSSPCSSLLRKRMIEPELPNTTTFGRPCAGREYSFIARGSRVKVSPAFHCRPSTETPKVRELKASPYLCWRSSARC